VKEITLEEVLERVTFDRGRNGELRVVDIKGHLHGNVAGSVYGEVQGSVWGKISGNYWGDGDPLN
jgi:hypothetical protein